MVVAVAVVLVVQVTIYQVVNVVAVGYSFVAAARTVNVAGIVTGAFVAVGASSGIGVVNFKSVLVNVVAVYVMHVAVMQVIHVIAVLYGSVAAVGAVLVVVIFVGIAL